MILVILNVESDKTVHIIFSPWNTDILIISTFSQAGMCLFNKGQSH